MGGEGEEEGGAGLGLALHPDLAVVQVGQVLDLDQPQAVPRLPLGGHPRLEDVGEQLGVVAEINTVVSGLSAQ